MAEKEKADRVPARSALDVSPERPEKTMETMYANTEEQTTVKTRRRTAVKAAVRQSAPKVKATLLLSEDASQRLSIHAAMMKEDRSALVDRLIREHLRRYVVSDRGGAVDSDDRLALTA